MVQSSALCFMHILLEQFDKNWVLNIPPADIPSSKRYQHMKPHPPRARRTN